MIEISKVEVVGWRQAIRGMRNPMNSWKMSDSVDMSNSEEGDFGFIIGENDWDLMRRLRNAGTDHRKYLRMIVVYADITAPLYWWSEYDTYKVGTVANSCSKMHKLLHKPFEMSDFSFDNLIGYKKIVTQFRPIFDYEEEEWKELGNGYSISNFGRVRNKHGRVLSGSVHKDGYIVTNMHGQQVPVHRLVAEQFLKNDAERNVVNHKDGNKMNNCVENLEWCTQSENVRHAIENNLSPKNIGTYKGKFTDEQRKEIKSLWDSGTMSRRKIAEKYGVSHSCISDIVNDKYKYADKINVFEEVARPIVDSLNELRDLYFRADDNEEKKMIWYSILQLLPNSYNQKRTVMLNYEVLSNQYHSRKNHKLDEWRDYCKWIESLPYSELITGGTNEAD